jgi:diacylglycerol O-acyltransferase
MDVLSPDDARILALETGNIRGHTCKVLVVAGELTVQAVRSHLAPRLEAFPALRRRLAPGPAWVEDIDFAVDRHVSGGEAVDDEGLRRLVRQVMAEPLPRDRPLWAMRVVPLDQGRAALVWRLHHALADGVTAMRMARELLLEPQDAAKPRPAPLLHGGAEATVSRRRKVAALRQELAHPGPRSPLDRPAGPRRDVAFVDASLDEVRRIAHGAPQPATINDVVLAALGGGLRRWMEALDAPSHALRVKVPVSLHHPGDSDAANRDSFIVVEIPLEEPDPLERLAAITRQTRRCKRRHDADTIDQLFRRLSRSSGSLERLAERWAMSPRVFALNVSNVPGPAGPQRVLGCPLLQLYSVAEIAHRHALRVAVISGAGRLSFGLCADADAVAELDVIAHGIERELGELGGSTPPAGVHHKVGAA